MSLPIYTVYVHPRDYPDEYVVRIHNVCSDGTVVADPNLFLRCAQLPPLRRVLAGLGLTRLDRDPDDDPAIAEVWL